MEQIDENSNESSKRSEKYLDQYEETDIRDLNQTPNSKEDMTPITSPKSLSKSRTFSQAVTPIQEEASEESFDTDDIENGRNTKLISQSKKQLL